jgi:hypothetical protein
MEIVAASRTAPWFARHDVRSLVARSRAFLAGFPFGNPDRAEYLRFAAVPQDGRGDHWCDSRNSVPRCRKSPGKAANTRRLQEQPLLYAVDSSIHKAGANPCGMFWPRSWQ